MELFAQTVHSGLFLQSIKSGPSDVADICWTGFLANSVSPAVQQADRIAVKSFSIESTGRQVWDRLDSRRLVTAVVLDPILISDNIRPSLSDRFPIVSIRNLCPWLPWRPWWCPRSIMTFFPIITRKPTRQQQQDSLMNLFRPKEKESCPRYPVSRKRDKSFN